MKRMNIQEHSTTLVASGHAARAEFRIFRPDDIAANAPRLTVGRTPAQPIGDVGITTSRGMPISTLP